MIPGVTIQMGGNEWVVPPLTLGQLRRLQPQLKAMTGIGQASGMTDEQIETIGEIVATALTRNYPDMTTDRVLELIDVGNAGDVIRAVLTGSGLRQGEVPAVPRGNGVTSMDSLPPPVGTLTQ